MKKNKLTDKQEKFCTKYIECLDMSESYRFAYNASKMKPNTINRRAFDLYNTGKIKARIDVLKTERSERTKIDADYVLKRLAGIDQMDVKDILEDNGDIKPIVEWPDVWRKTISGIDISAINVGDVETVLKKIKWPDKLKNLELIGKHVEVQAFKDKLDHSSSDGSMTPTVIKRVVIKSK